MPGVYSENLGMTVKFLTRRDENYIYAATPTLMLRPELFPCDKKGNIIGVNAPVAVGIHPVLPDVDLDSKLQSIALALGVPLDVVKQMAEGKVVGISPDKEQEVAETPDLAVVETAGISPPTEDSESEGADQESVGDTDLEPAQEEFVFDPEAVWSNYNRPDMCLWALGKYGDKAASIDPEWSRKDIMGAIEMLEGPPAE